MPIRRLSAALSLLVALTLSGCIRDVASVAGPGTKASGGTGSSGSTADLVGSYNMITVNGRGLPFVYASGDTTYAILDDAITMTSAGAWTETWHDRLTIGAVVRNRTNFDAGTFSATSTSIVVTSTTTGFTQTWQSTYNNGTLTLIGQSRNSGQNVTMVYSK